MQLVIDERANAEQRNALTTILTGGETDEMATVWWILSAMCPNKLETLFRPIEFDVDVEARRGRFSVPGIVETVGEPIRNPVTGAEHRARIELPHGFEYRVAEMGSATTRACLRMVDISTAGTPSLVQSLDVGKNGADVYFPAVTIDAAGNTFFAYSVSSASMFASAAAGEIQAGVVTGTQVYEAGQQTYGGTRWGDYSGISIDPTTGQVWAAAEYSALGSSHDWGTAAGNFSA